jgi:hypothetical protein
MMALLGSRDDLFNIAYYRGIHLVIAFRTSSEEVFERGFPSIPRLTSFTRANGGL